MSEELEWTCPRCNLKSENPIGHMFLCRKAPKAPSGAEKLARSILGVGHDDDCLFCGFKDKAALAALEHGEATG